MISGIVWKNYEGAKTLWHGWKGLPDSPLFGEYLSYNIDNNHNLDNIKLYLTDLVEHLTPIVKLDGQFAYNPLSSSTIACNRELKGTRKYLKGRRHIRPWSLKYEDPITQIMMENQNKDLYSYKYQMHVRGTLGFSDLMQRIALYEKYIGKEHFVIGNLTRSTRNWSPWKDEKNVMMQMA